jgi:MOSC domain-containing protein YiiM
VVLEVSEPRLPCWKLGYKMEDPRFLKRFARALRPGAYLRIIEEGSIGAGDAIEVIERPEHAIDDAVDGPGAPGRARPRRGDA